MARLLTAAALAAAALSAAPASAADIVNENFDAGFGVFTVESTTIARTTARPLYQICCGANGSDAALDNPFVVFGGGNIQNRGSIFTEFQTFAGSTYTLSFRAGAFGAGEANLSYVFGGQTGTLTLAANNNVDTTFGTYTYSFVGNGGVATLGFSSRGPGTNVDPALDDVLVTAVPEPAAWATMIAGFAIVGGALRRRRSDFVTA